MRIMIVDDNAAMRKVLAALLTSAGHEVVATLEDGNALEDQISELMPDVVCLDYNLPGRDGLTLIKVVHARWPQIDVIFITGSSESGIEEKSADAGASGFIRKPFSQEQIVGELRAVEETRRSTRGAAVPAGAATIEAAASHAKVRATALIADDNASIRLVLASLLKDCGVTVAESVSNGAEAVLGARIHRPRLVFLDVNMPVMGGLEALPKVIEACPQTSVVMVTACADKALVAQAAALGAVGYILKPLRPAYVENFIRRFFGD